MKPLLPIVNDRDIQSLVAAHALFARIQAQYGNPPNWSRLAGFEALCKIILEQQVSLASAHAHFIKLKSYLPAFTPQHILQLTAEEMLACQISRQKAKYLQALSTAIINGSLQIDELHKLPEEEVRKQLIAIKGIGNWTADIYLLICLQAADIFPQGDVALINTIKELTPAKTKEEILELSQTWKPNRSLATFFLWHYYLKKRNRSMELFL